MTLRQWSRAGANDNVVLLAPTIAVQGIQGPDCLEMDLIVAGWSESAGPDLYLLRTMANTPTPAWRVIDTRRSSSHPEQRRNICRSQRTMSDIGILNLEEIMG
jgi:hypothetical protein